VAPQQRADVQAFFIFVLTALAASPRFDGRGAGENCQSLPGVADYFIHQHEEAADTRMPPC